MLNELRFPTYRGRGSTGFRGSVDPHFFEYGVHMRRLTPTCFSYSGYLSVPWVYRQKENKTNLPLPLNVQKLKAFQLQGALHLTLTKGFAPEPPLGALPPDPVIGSRSALAISFAYLTLTPSPTFRYPQLAACNAYNKVCFRIILPINRPISRFPFYFIFAINVDIVSHNYAF